MDNDNQLDLPLEFEPETASSAVQRALRLGMKSACLTTLGSTIDASSEWTPTNGPLHHLSGGMATGGGMATAASLPPSTTEPVAEDGLTPTDFVVWLAGAADLEHGDMPSPAQWSRIVHRARNQVAGVARARFAKRGVYNPITKY